MSIANGNPCHCQLPQNPMAIRSARRSHRSLLAQLLSVTVFATSGCLAVPINTAATGAVPATTIVYFFAPELPDGAKYGMYFTSTGLRVSGSRLPHFECPRSTTTIGPAGLPPHGWRMVSTGYLLTAIHICLIWNAKQTVHLLHTTLEPLLGHRRTRRSSRSQNQEMTACTSCAGRKASLQVSVKLQTIRRHPFR